MSEKTVERRLETRRHPPIVSGNLRRAERLVV